MNHRVSPPRFHNYHKIQFPSGTLKSPTRNEDADTNIIKIVDIVMMLQDG